MRCGKVRRGFKALALTTLIAAAAACSADSGEDGDGDSTAVVRAGTFSMFRAGNRYGGDTGDAYYDSVQKVMGSRCAVCHSCTNGACQVNLTSYDAAARGMSKENPYDFGPLQDKRSTRVSDNLPVAAWRQRGFTPILPESGSRPEESMFFRALKLGEKNVPGDGAAEGAFSMATARHLAGVVDRGDAACPANKREFDQFEEKTPLGGMPWALPALTVAESKTLQDWVLAGARGPSPAARARVARPERTALSTMDPNALIAKWETFLDGDSPEQQLVGRYIYEHAFQANVHFTENPGEYYRIVRSRTAAPKPIDRIVTDMATDDPRVARVHYRLEKNDRLIEGKTHIVWSRSLEDLQHLSEQFFAKPWRAGTLPGYGTNNPFKNFDAIPAAARSRFMIENSRMLFQSFARGPICMIQIATYAVDEHFWMWFMRPESDPSVLDPKLGMENYDAFFDKAGNAVSGVPILGNKYDEPKYRAAFESTLRRLKPQGLGVEDIWDGDGDNPNAWLSVHRHQVSTDVTTPAERPIAGTPRSVWLMSYANFERMYYNAAVSYRYWGALKHQNDTFLWQTFTRTEAEDLYTSLFADTRLRSQLRDRYTTLKGKVYGELFQDYAHGRPARGNFATEDALARAVYARLGEGVVVQPDRLNHWPSDPGPSAIPTTVRSTADFEAGLRALTQKVAPYARFVPNIVHVRLGGENLYTILADRGYHNDKISAGEKAARDSSRDKIVAVPGFSGFEAHLFFDIKYENAAAFLTELSKVTSKEGFDALRVRYGIKRNSPHFWPFVDWLHAYIGKTMPVEAGLLELRFYDKDEMPY